MPPRHPDSIIPPSEEVVVSTKRVACDGGGGALGHPLVYMDMGEDDFVECGYCDRRFVLKDGPADRSRDEVSAGDLQDRGNKNQG
jgi:uncharacterized Zn-finger protein